MRIVGMGPGAPALMSGEAAAAIGACDLIVGYTTYIGLLGDLVAGKEVFASSMTEEVKRADHAIEAARAGRRVAVVAGGDACVYGIGGLVLERLSPGDLASIDIEVIPGITAANAAAALLGAPLMNDYLVLSLSDLLTDAALIRRRVEAAGHGDLALALYNPRSASRKDLLAETREILLRHRPASTPVGIVRLAYREGQGVTLCTLGELGELMDGIDMFSIVIIGSSLSVRKGDFIVTPRGYPAGGVR